MNTIGSFQVNLLHYGVTQLSDGYYKIQVPSMSTQRSAFHVAPEVYAVITHKEITLTGLPGWLAIHAEEIKNGIKDVIGA